MPLAAGPGPSIPIKNAKDEFRSGTDPSSIARLSDFLQVQAQSGTAYELPWLASALGLDGPACVTCSGLLASFVVSTNNIDRESACRRFRRAGGFQPGLGVPVRAMPFAARSGGAIHPHDPAGPHSERTRRVNAFSRHVPRARPEIGCRQEEEAVGHQGSPRLGCRPGHGRLVEISCVVAVAVRQHHADIFGRRRRCDNETINDQAVTPAAPPNCRISSTAALAWTPPTKLAPAITAGPCEPPALAGPPSAPNP